MSADADIIASMDLGATLRAHGRGQIVWPLINNYFNTGRTPSMAAVADRLSRLGAHPLDLVAGDGWFHASTHPLQSESALYHYLVEPENLVAEHIDMPKRLSFDVGSMTHAYIQTAMDEIGILPAVLQKCTTCQPERHCDEPGVMDEEIGMRGHLDGILALPGREYGGDLFDLKTTGERGSMSMKRLLDLDLEAFKEQYPGYYAQMQCYLKMSGREQMILCMIMLGMPWVVREFHIPHDRRYTHRLWAKLARVREAVAHRRPPVCGCPEKTRARCAAHKLCLGAA